MQYAGHAVVACGGTVAISLCALLVIPVPLLRSMGFGGMLIPLVSTAVILTLLPALLAPASGRGSTGRGSGTRTGVAGLDGLGPRRRPLALARRRPRAGHPRRADHPVFGIKIGQARPARWPAAGRPTSVQQTLQTAASPAARLADGGADQGPTRQAASGRGDHRGPGSRRRGGRLARTRQWRAKAARVVEVIPTDETVDSTQARRGRRRRARASTATPAVGSPGFGATVPTTSTRSTRSSLRLGLIALVTFRCWCGRSGRCCCRSRPWCST